MKTRASMVKSFIPIATGGECLIVLLPLPVRSRDGDVSYVYGGIRQTSVPGRYNQWLATALRPRQVGGLHGRWPREAKTGVGVRQRSACSDRFVAAAALLCCAALVVGVATSTPAQAGGCSEACDAHGLCRDGKCWCEKGWVGDDCSTEGDNPCEVSCYGRGEGDPETVACTCEDGWAGPFCGRMRKEGGKTERSARADRRQGRRQGRGGGRQAAAPPCPPELRELAWWQRYKVAASLNEEDGLERLRNCEARPDPSACVEALVKLGEVRAPAFPGCEYGASLGDQGP